MRQHRCGCKLRRLSAALSLPLRLAAPSMTGLPLGDRRPSARAISALRDMESIRMHPDAPSLPVVDLEPCLGLGNISTQEAVLRAAQAILTSLQETSCVIVRDPRVPQDKNDEFLNHMEDYFARPYERKMQDVRASLAYQVGATPENIEVPRCICDAALQAKIAGLPEDSKPTMPTSADVKWRYLWRIGDRPANTEYPELNAQPVVPEGFPDWTQKMDTWGTKLVDTAMTVSELIARGYDLSADTFARLLHLGPHLLAPTGTDLTKHGQLGTVFAGYHYDLNFLTVHGRSRYPGLFIWLRNGARVPVRLPAGCILLQAGRQLEWLTAGDIEAGMHEVVCVPETLAAKARVEEEGRRPLWRVSSTVFVHVASDAVLRPLPRFDDAGGAYPSVAAGRYVQEELDAIKLARARTASG